MLSQIFSKINILCKRLGTNKSKDYWFFIVFFIWLIFIMYFSKENYFIWFISSHFRLSSSFYLIRTISPVYTHIICIMHHLGIFVKFKKQNLLILFMIDCFHCDLAKLSLTRLSAVIHNNKMIVLSLFSLFLNKKQ